MSSPSSTPQTIPRTPSSPSLPPTEFTHARSDTSPFTLGSTTTTPETKHRLLSHSANSASAPSLSRKNSNGPDRRLRFTTLSEGRSKRRKVIEDDDDNGEGDESGKERTGWEALRSDPGTPNISETAAQIRRTLSLASLTYLHSQLITHPPTTVLTNVTQHTKTLVWRSPREARKLPQDAERALVLALRRGIRSGVLGWGVRAGVGVVLAVVNALRRRRFKWMLVRMALFGAEPFRFAAMIGTFTFLNTLTLHLLRLAPPYSYLSRRLSHFYRSIRTGSFTSPTFGPPERYTGALELAHVEIDEEYEEGEGYYEEDNGERRWQAAVAGAVGSLGLLWEEKGRRVGVAQQMFVRGLQASYNTFSLRTGFEIPYGDLIVFGFCCGQIMFAFLMSPETIPVEYNSWILKASHAEPAAIPFNRQLERQGVVDVLMLQKALSNKRITPHNATDIQQIIERAKEGIAPHVLPCSVVHPWHDSCRAVPFERFFTVVRFMLPAYAALHLIPMLILRRKHVQRDPLGMLGRALKGTLRSSSFLGVFVVIFHTILCLRTNIVEGHVKFFNMPLPGWLTRLFKKRQSFWLMGFATCLSLLVEEKKRRAELAMYVLPRGLESAWSSARRRSWLPIVPFGETLMGMVAMGMVMDAYKHEPKALSSLLRGVIYQLIGPP